MNKMYKIINNDSGSLKNECVKKYTYFLSKKHPDDICSHSSFYVCDTENIKIFNIPLKRACVFSCQTLGTIARSTDTSSQLKNTFLILYDCPKLLIENFVIAFICEARN